MRTLKGIVLTAVVCSALSVVAADEAKEQKRPAKPTYAQLLAHKGGQILDERAVKGKVVLLSVGGAIKRTELEKVIEHIRDYMLLYKFEIVEKDNLKEFGEGLSAYATAVEKLGCGALVAIVSDATSPAMLAAPEDGWAVVNVSKMDRNLKTDSAKAKFLAPRIRREVLRAFAYACNAGGSGYSGNLMSIGKLEDVDLRDEYYPYDTMQQIANCLRERGVMPAKEVSYRKACREGWAPAPTNDIQKAVWDKVREIPTKPIKIEYDPKKGE